MKLKKEEFLKVINVGLRFTEMNKLVTFGVVPRSPEVGYGYIRLINLLALN